jgi:Plasmid pRiA4b ORF-3-like protein
VLVPLAIIPLICLISVICLTATSYFFAIKHSGPCDNGCRKARTRAATPGDFLDARKARLGDVLEDIGTKKLVYLYDFGDGWEHTIKIERLVDPESGQLRV